MEERYTITKKSYAKNGQEAEGSKLAEFGEYGQAYEEAKRILQGQTARRVLFLQRFKGGQMVKEYQIQREATPRPRQGETIAQEARRKAAEDMAELRRETRAEAYRTAKANGLPFSQVYTKMLEDEHEDNEKAKAEKVRRYKEEAKQRREAAKRQAKGDKAKQSQAAELLEEISDITQGRF